MSGSDPILNSPSETVVNRFLRYVRIDTESLEGQTHVPSTPGQWDLAKLLADELTSLGAANVRISETCTVYATIPATPGVTSEVPAVGLLAHVDTSPAVTGRNVQPIVHTNYQGGDIVLPGDPTQVISAARTPALARLIGDDIITSDGTTLLGSDDKAGVATIMGMVDVLAANPQIEHGPIAIAFTADEEVGTGIESFDIEGFGARFAYTVDGDELGEINHETWNALSVTLTFHGVSAHPGTAKGTMVNSAYAVAHLLSQLPEGMRPEATEGREGFVHPYAGTLDVETSVLRLILRDFDAQDLAARETFIRELAGALPDQFPGLSVDIEVREQYRNMDEVLRDHPRLVKWAFEAARRAGLTPVSRPVRGGTDGARLTFRGLPCPNIFNGGYNFHSKLEFNSRRGLEKTVETLVHLVQVIRAGV